MSTEPLTGAHRARLQDAANIETTVPPGIDTVAKFTIPRFSTLSVANAAVTASGGPNLHQLRWIEALSPRGLQIYNGTAWVDYYSFVLIDELNAVKNDTTSRSSSVAAIIPGLSLPVVDGAVYRVTLQLIYSTESGTIIEINSSFPGAASRLSLGVTGKGEEAGGSSQADRVNLANHQSRVSGDSPHRLRGSSGWLGNTMSAEFRGVLRSAANGEFAITHRRIGTAGGEVRVNRDSLLVLKRIS